MQRPESFAKQRLESPGVFYSSPKIRFGTTLEQAVFSLTNY